jgi:hypothetical protein
MTRKDFELIARVLDSSAQSTAINPFTGKNIYVELAEDFAKALQEANPRFNRELFLKACGV